MATHQISITVKDDSIRAVPETLVMNVRDDVRWVGTTSRHFSIAFEGAGPFEQAELDHAAAAARRRPRATGRYKYSVIATDPPGPRLDPVIIVEEPPSGPP